MKQFPFTFGVLCIAITLCLSTFSSNVAAQPETKGLAAEQYKVVKVDEGADRKEALLEAQLNKLAQEGWKLRAIQLRWLILVK